MIYAFSMTGSLLWSFVQVASLVIAYGVISIDTFQAPLNYNITTKDSTNNWRRLSLGHADFSGSSLQRHVGAENVPKPSLKSAYITESSGPNASFSAKDKAQFIGDWGKITFPVLATSGGSLPPANKTHVFDVYVKNRQAWKFPLSQGLHNLQDRADYLAVQSSFTIYGREPACTAAYSSFIATEPMTLSTSASLSYETLGNGQHTIITSNITKWVSAGAQGFCCGGAGALPLIPGCLVHGDKLQLLYWPSSHPNATYPGNTAPSFINNRTLLSHTTSASRPEISNVSVYAYGPDGYKYESPSLYIIYPTLLAYDRCGTVGPSRTSLTLAFEPGELSTVIYNATAKTFTTFALNINDLPNDPHRSRLALAPRFFNVLDQYKPVQVSILPSLISPFLALPSKITHLVPAWSGCEMDPRGGIDPPRPLSPATAMNPVHTVDDLTPQSTAAKPSPLVSSLPIETGTILPQPSPRYPDQGNSPKPQPPPRANSPSDTEALTEVPHRTNSETAPGTVSPSIRRGDGQVVVPQPSDTRSILDPQEYSIGTQATVGDLSRARDSAGIEHKTLRSFSSGKPDPTQQDDSGDRLATWSKGPGSTPNQDVQDPLVTWLRRLGSTPVDYTKDPRTTGSENPEFPQDGIDSSSLAPGYTKPIPPAVAIQGQTITNNAAPITIGGAKVAYQSGILSVDNIIQPVPLATNRGAMHTNLFVVGDLSFSILPAAAQADVTHPVENAPGTTPHVDKNNIPPSKHPDSIKFTSHVDINNIPPGKHPDSLEYVMVGSQTFTLQSNAIQVAGKTLKAGDPAITVDGTPISLGYSEFVFGTRTEVFSLPTMSATPDTVVSMDDTIFTLKGGSLVVTGKTVTIGEPAATINGIPISLGYSEFVFGTRTEMFSLPTMSATPDTVLSMDDTIVTLKGGSLVVAGKTVTIGEPAATINGIPISLGYSEFVFGTRTEVFSLPTMSVISDTVVSMDDTIVTLKGGSLVVAGKTVTIGEPAATINGIPISLGSSELVVGSQTRSFAFPINTMGPNDSGNLDELITPGLDRIGGGVVDTPSTPGTGTTGTSNAKDSTPYLGQTVNLCVPVRIYLAWATALLTVFLIWS